MKIDYITDSQTIVGPYNRSPHIIYSHKNFDGLQNDAKILYSRMLELASLSVKNGWHDKEGRYYIYVTLAYAASFLKVGRNKALKMLAQLETAGLIERKRQGLGRPNRIYVKKICLEKAEEADMLDSERLDIAISMPDMPYDTCHVAACVPQEGKWTEQESILSRPVETLSEEVSEEKRRSNLKKLGSLNAMILAQLPQYRNYIDLVPDENKCAEKNECTEENPPVTAAEEKEADDQAVVSADVDECGMSEITRKKMNLLKERLTSKMQYRETRHTRPQKFINEISRNLEMKLQEVPKQDFKKFGNETSMPDPASDSAGFYQDLAQKFTSDTPETPRSLKSGLQEVSKSNSNKIELEKDRVINNTIYPSIIGGPDEGAPKTACKEIAGTAETVPDDETTIPDDETAWNKILHKSLEIIPGEDKRADELIGLMAEVMSSPDDEKIRIGGINRNIGAVKGRFLTLTHEHIQYVLYCLDKATTKVHNIKNYLLSALYNSSLTMNNFFGAEVLYNNG